MKTPTLVAILVFACSVLAAGHAADSYGEGASTASDQPNQEPADSNTQNSSNGDADGVRAEPMSHCSQCLNVTPGDGQVTLDWTRPQHIILGNLWYEVLVGSEPLFDTVPDSSVWFDPNRQRGTLVSGDTTSYTVTGLQNGVEYDFFVQPFDDYFWFWYYDVNNRVLATPGPPPAPDVSVIPGDGILMLDWSVADNGTRAPITEYVIAYRIGNVNPFATLATVPVSTTSYTVEGLTNGMQYQLVVFAVNSNGTGPASDIAYGIPSSRPGAPTNLQGELDRNGQLTLTWDAPDQPHAKIESYIVNVKSVTHSIGSFAQVYPWIIYDGTSATINIVVYPHTFYSVTVVAINAVGPGPASEELDLPISRITIPP